MPEIPGLERLFGEVVHLSRGKTTVSDLAQKFEVTERQITRDLKRIEKYVPINRKAGQGGGVSMDVQKWLINAELRGTDIASIVVALSALAPGGVVTDFERALDSIVETLTDEQKAKLREHYNQVHVDLWPQGLPKDIKSKLQVIDKAMYHHRLVEFTYTDVKGRKSTRLVEPYRRMLMGSTWFLYGYCRLRDDFREFRLSRIEDISMAEEVFEQRQLPDGFVSLWNSDHIPENSRLDLHIRCDEVGKNYITEAFRPSWLLSCENGLWECELATWDWEWTYGFLLSCANHIEVLSPSCVRNRLKEMADSVAKLYK